LIVLWAILGIGLSLAGELGLGRFAPGATHYVSLMTLPLVAYALRTSQRSSMVVGCVSGLLEDYWIEPRLFGLNGVVKTILGWALGGLGARFDLNNAGPFRVRSLGPSRRCRLQTPCGDCSARGRARGRRRPGIRGGGRLADCGSIGHRR
jgi:hypothetical protein